MGSRVSCKVALRKSGRLMGAIAISIPRRLLNQAHMMKIGDMVKVRCDGTFWVFRSDDGFMFRWKEEV